MSPDAPPEPRSPDLAIVGGGSAAFAAALRARELGARVLLIEAGTIGGTCVNTGCVPSKTMIRAAGSAHASRVSRFAGIEPLGCRVDFGTVARDQQALVERLRRAKYEDVLARDPDIGVLRGRARLVDAHTLEVAGREIRAARILIATGTRPALPPVPGLDDPGVWDSTRALAAREAPRELVVLGGRFVALELGQMFARLGSRVTIVQRSERILPHEDPDISETLAGLLREEGIGIRTGRTLQRVAREDGRLCVEVSADGGGEVLCADAVLAALGRTPNTEALGALARDAQGFVRVDAQLRTSLSGVWAAGDVIGDPMNVYAAAYEGALAADNALSGAPRERDYTGMPWVVFTDPQVAAVGLDERGAARAGIAVDVSKLPLDRVPRALAAHDTRGFVKLLRERGTDRLVGARIVAPEAGELVMEPSLMIRFALPIGETARHFHAYLTQNEAIKLAALAFDKDVDALSCCAT